MATSTPLKPSGNNETSSDASKLKLVPLFPKHVFLYDWWLIKADTPSNGRGLGVGGLSSKEQVGVRVLHSAAIVKRHNTNTVETADGLTITFSGSINKQRTVLNGFPSEVCNQFIFGFPYCWEELPVESFAKEASNRAVDNSVDAANFLTKSFDKLSGALIRDLFVSTIENSGSCQLRSIFGDMLHTYGADSLDQKVESIYPGEVTTYVGGDFVEEDEIHNCHKKMEVKQKQKQKDEDDIAGSKPRKKFQKVSRELGIGPSTSSSQMIFTNDKQEEGNLLCSPEKPQLIKFLSEAPIGQRRGSIARRNMSSLSSTTRTLFLRNRSIDFSYKR